MQLEIQIRDGVTPVLEPKLAAMTPQAIAATAGPELQNLTRTHLGRLPRNKKGWPSTRFYDRFVDNVHFAPRPDGVLVFILPAIIHGRSVTLHQRYYGGTLTAKTVEMLAIPISPVSYGKVPSDFPGLFLIRTPKGAYLVQRGEGVSESGRVGPLKFSFGNRPSKNESRRRAAALNFLFKLQRSVDQAGDKSILPTDEQYLDTGLRALGRHWDQN